MTVLTACASVAPSLPASRLCPLVVKTPFSCELHDPESLVPPPVGGIAAGTTPSRGFALQSPEEEPPQAGAAGHAPHHLADHCDATVRQARLDLLLHERPPGAPAVRPSATSHATDLSATLLAAASLLTHPGVVRVASVGAAPVHRPPVARRGAERRLRSGGVPIALRLWEGPRPGRLGRCAALAG